MTKYLSRYMIKGFGQSLFLFFICNRLKLVFYTDCRVYAKVQQDCCKEGNLPGIGKKGCFAGSKKGANGELAEDFLKLNRLYFQQETY